MDVLAYFFLLLVLFSTSIVYIIDELQTFDIYIILFVLIFIFYIMNKDFINLQIPDQVFLKVLNHSLVLYERIFQEDKLFRAHATNVEINAFHEVPSM